MNYEKNSHVCTLQEPAECKYCVKGKFSFINLCGGNSLFDDVKNCKNRIEVTVKEVTHDRHLQRGGEGVKK